MCRVGVKKFVGGKFQRCARKRRYGTHRHTLKVLCMERLVLIRMILIKTVDPYSKFLKYAKM